MSITIGGWIGILIGFAIGGFLGVIAGFSMADNYWKQTNMNAWNGKSKTTKQAPDEIEKR